MRVVFAAVDAALPSILESGSAAIESRLASVAQVLEMIGNGKVTAADIAFAEEVKRRRAG
ncbi:MULTISPECIES: hypothetical protein [Frankia]|uniref:hypothetical protein n=1 Tax=Frankia TaxID=1854 RepID=UPI0004DD6638|nr:MULTISPECIES: hypothetical protein [Frankia]KEZ34526.1 hypothetical protein CEDDRAFT_04108 [Frankia sp. CeD]OHV49454.1 hypothetical protein CgIS1_21105 [Frankia sp. CgIS1]